MNDIYNKVLNDSRLKDIPVLYIIRITVIVTPQISQSLLEDKQ